jgi:hypothetical protein
MTVTEKFKEASALAAIRSLRGLEQTAIMLETYAPEIFPEVKITNGIEQKHFGRVMMESAAQSIRDAWAAAIHEVEAFPLDTDGIIEQRGKLRRALQKIADLADSEAGEPLDEAIEIANDALKQ